MHEKYSQTIQQYKAEYDIIGWETCQPLIGKALFTDHSAIYTMHKLGGELTGLCFSFSSWLLVAFPLHPENR